MVFCLAFTSSPVLSVILFEGGSLLKDDGCNLSSVHVGPRSVGHVLCELIPILVVGFLDSPVVSSKRKTCSMSPKRATFSLSFL